MNFIDLVGSTILAAAVIAAILGLNFLLADTSREVTTDLSVQENMVDFSRMIQHDFSKIGQGDTLSAPVLVALKNRITFIGDIKNQNRSDTVTYVRGDSTMLTYTPNPRDFPLFKIIRKKSATYVKPDTIRMSLGLTKFELSYFDTSGALTTDPKKVKGLKVAVRSENAFPGHPEDTKQVLFTGADWDATIYPRNLNVPKK